MNPKNGALRAATLAALMTWAWIPSLASAKATDLNIGGTGFGLGIMRRLGVAFARSHPDVRINIVPSLGSSGGIEASLAGALDLAVSGRALKENERSRGCRAAKLARTPFVFIVNGSANKREVTTGELEEIYVGRILSWPDGERIRLVLRSDIEVDMTILKGLSPMMERAVKAASSRDGMILAVTDQDNVDAVETTVGALGGGTLMQVLTEERRVVILALNGVKPSVGGMRDGSYPLAKTLYLVTTPRTPAAAQRFIEFIRSKQGVAEVAKYGALVVEAGGTTDHE